MWIWPAWLVEVQLKWAIESGTLDFICICCLAACNGGLLIVQLEIVKQFFNTTNKMRTFFSFSLLVALLGTVSAQFNFFEQMFGGNGGGQQQQQQQQNVPSDSSYYRSQVDRGKFSSASPFLQVIHEEL